MHWVLKPRLNSAVATVAVLMVLSLLRVVSLILVMVCLLSVAGHSEARGARTRNLEIPRCAIAHLRSGPSDHPGMTGCLNKSTARRPARRNRFRESQNRSP